MSFAVQTVKEIFELVRDDLALVEREIAGQNAAAIEPVCEFRAICARVEENGFVRLYFCWLLGRRVIAGLARFGGRGGRADS